jgi:hypothetical protein
MMEYGSALFVSLNLPEGAVWQVILEIWLSHLVFQSLRLK